MLIVFAKRLHAARFNSVRMQRAPQFSSYIKRSAHFVVSSLCCQPTTSSMSGRARSALADLNSDAEEDDHTSFPWSSASSRATGPAATDLEDVRTCYFCFILKLTGTE